MAASSLNFRLAAALACVLIGVSVSAQDTRTGTIAAEQSKKAQALKPDGPSKAEQITVRILSSPLLAAHTGPYPWFGSVFGGSGFAAGAGYMKKLPRGSGFNALAGVSIEASTMFEVDYQPPELWRGMATFNTFYHRKDVNNVRFYGGQQSSPDELQRYDYQPDEIGVDGRLQLLKRFAFTGGLSRVAIDTRAGEAQPEAHASHPVPGVGESLEYNVQRIAAVVDWRQSPLYSTSGGMYQLTYERHDEAANKPYSFHSAELEVVQLVPLLNEQYVLAFRGLATFSTSEPGETTPAILAPYLGSGSTMRAFPTRRFTDRNRALLTGEYRWRPSRYLDMAVFMDAGQVFPEKSEFKADRFKTDWGVGMRVHGPTFTAVRIEAATGHEGWRIVFSNGQPF
jgi:hypothetical protein